MNAYLSVLRISDYRKLWVGSLLSLLGDGASWVALAWMALAAGGTGALSVIGICYMLPVLLGGAVVGPILDRFSRRRLLIADNVTRGLVMASVPLVALAGDVPLGLLFTVAAVFGLLKIVPLGAVPAVVPELVPADRLQPAAALETIGYGAAGLIGPALAGILIPFIGGEGVLAIDAATYGLFALLVLSMKAKLPRPQQTGSPDAPAGSSDAPVGYGWKPALAILFQDRVLLAITLSFMAFNFVFGMITILAPWLVKFEFDGHPQVLGLLLATLSGAELLGSFVGGMLKPVDRVMLRMGLLQICAGLGLLLLFVRSVPTVLLALLVVGLLSGPVTVSSLALRMGRIPDALRGRTMTLMRTLMNASPPLGAAVTGILLSSASYSAAVAVMVLSASLPGVAVALAYRRTSFASPKEPASIALPTETAADPQPAAG